MKKTNLRTSLSRTVPVILIILLVLIAIFALVSLGKALFGKNNTTTQTTVSKAVEERNALLSTDLSRAVQMTVRGPIVANENFKSYRIIIKSDSRSLDIYKGYLEDRVDGISLDNNVRAYEEFVFALDKANLSVGTAFSGAKDDTRGICATGTVTEYDLLKYGDSIKHLWTSTCRGSQGSLAASNSQVKNLFLAQIPGASELLRKTNSGF